MSKLPKRRAVEIYFVLYLAALVFLLPDKRDFERFFINNLGTPVYQPLFSLLPEKTTLTCRAIIDSTGPTIVSLDSVNTIFYSGDVESVQFEFEIFDQTLKQSLKLSSDTKTTTRFFKMTQHKNQQAATFIWNPPLYEKVSKTYQVRVIATARSRGDNPIFVGQKTPSGKPQTFRVKTQFSLLLIYLNKETGLPVFQQPEPGIDTNALFNPFRNFLPQIPTGRISLTPETYDLKAIAYQKWTNIMYAFNINLLRDLDKSDIKVSNEPRDNGGEAYILNTQEDKFYIHGKTPSYGRMKVTVYVKRKYDGAESSKEFYVSPQTYEQPEYDQYMYPEQTYLIDPKLPLLGKETKAYIKDGSVIKARSNQGEKFQFSPELRDTGKILYLERYIDNNLLGQPSPIRILTFPEPEILELRERAPGEIDVQTRSFGFYNKELNEVVRFEIQGNAKYEDKRGRVFDMKDSPVRIQHFVFKAANPNRPFEFRIVAIDKRGKRSFSKSYKKD